MSQESVTVAHRKSPLTKSVSSQHKKSSVPTITEPTVVSGEGKRKARRALSLELQLDDDMDAKKDRTVAFEDLLSKALTFFESENRSPQLKGTRTADSFLLVYKWYIPPEQLFNILTNTVFKSGVVPNGVLDSDNADGPSGDVVNGSRGSISKWAVVRTVHYWVQQYSEDFKLDQSLAKKLSTFQEELRESGEGKMADLINLDDCPELPWLTSVPQTPAVALGDSHPLNSTKPAKKGSVAFESMTAEELADTLVAIDMKYFRRIPFTEFHAYARAVGPTAETPRIRECINWFNGLSLWTQSSILRQRASVGRRAKTLLKFIDVVKELCELNSLNTALSVIGGLQAAPIKRLVATWAELPKGKAEELDQLAELFAVAANFSKYRHKITSVRENGQFVLPVLGILLRDLCAIQMGTSDWSKRSEDSHMVNMDKYDNLHKVFSLIKYCQSQYPPTKVEMDFMRILRAAVMHIHLTDDTLMEYSYELESKEQTKEGKDHKIEVKSSNIMTFADFASGQNEKKDPQTIRRNVEKMVDAMLRMYAKDKKSDTITINDFTAIQSNFPFIEDFSVLDENNDGLLSRAELIQYFLRANQQLRGFFKHDFLEQTFFSPGTCWNCNGRIWGLVQGVKCRDCGITCHKDCKNWVVVECRKERNLKGTEGVRKGRKIRRNVSTSAVSMNQVDGGCTEDEPYENVFERLQRAEEARDALAAEVSEVKKENVELRAQILALQQHIGQIRQHTIGFILEQMNTLSLQDDTEV